MMPCRSLPLLAIFACCGAGLTQGAAGASEAFPSEFRVLVRLAPEESSVFLVARPQQLADSRLWKQLRQLAPIQMESLAPFDVELLAVAISAEDAIGPFLPSKQMRAFEAIAANLDGGEFDQHEIDRHVPRCAILLRCSHAVGSQQIGDLMARMLPAPSGPQLANFRSVAWKGREILRRDAKDSPAAMRIDERTFIIADHESFANFARAGGEAKQTRSQRLQHQAMWQKVAEVHSADLALAVDAQQLLALANEESLEIPVFLQQSVWAAVSVSLSAGDLISAEFEFTNIESANQLRATLDRVHQLAIAQLPALWEQQIPQSGQSLESAETLLPFIESLQTHVAGQTVTLRLPRPANWDRVIDSMVRQAHTKRERKLHLSEIRRRAYSGEVPSTRIPVYAGRLNPGDKLMEPYVTVGIWPTEDLPEGVILSQEALIGATTTRRVDAHMPIVEDDLQ